MKTPEQGPAAVSSHENKIEGGVKSQWNKGSTKSKEEGVIPLSVYIKLKIDSCCIEVCVDGSNVGVSGKLTGNNENAFQGVFAGGKGLAIRDAVSRVEDISEMVDFQMSRRNHE